MLLFRSVMRADIWIRCLCASSRQSCALNSYYGEHHAAGTIRGRTLPALERPARNQAAAIIMLTARGEESERVRGLATGPEKRSSLMHVRAASRAAGVRP
jgi:hypothetical protein